MSFICPPAASVADIPLFVCPENFGQIQKFGLQRAKTGTTENWIPIADAVLLATYTALKAAADSTKVQFTPFISEPNNEPGEARKFGGGNATVGGVELIIGRNPSPFTGAFLRYPQEIIEEIKKYQNELDLRVFLINEFGQIGCAVDDHANPTKVRGLPIRGFFVSDKGFGNFEAVDRNNFEWQFLPNWSDKFHIIEPTDFDALSQL